MNRKGFVTNLPQVFLCTAGITLLVTGFAKIESAVFGGSEYLRRLDPITGMQFGHLMFAAGVLELIIAGVCFSLKMMKPALVLVTCLSMGFLIYRVGLVMVGYQRPCNCLGNLTDALHINPQIADAIMKIALVYLLAGSCASIFWLWRRKQKIGPATGAAVSSELHSA